MIENWKSIGDMFRAVNKEHYLVLRNYENMLDILGTNDDIDILCDNTQSFVETLGAVPLPGNKPYFNYYVMVDDKKLLLDIRTVGDGYYDSNWESRMLGERIPLNDFFILDEENYKYSLLYHVLVQKRDDAAGKYKKQIEDLFGLNIEDKESCCKCLLQYLKEKGYRCVEPIDRGVYINYDVFHYINSQIDECIF